MSNFRLSGVLAGIAGVALFSWVLFDASSIVSVLQLSGFMSEAAVAVTSLVLAAAFIAAALFSFRVPLPSEPRR